MFQISPPLKDWGDWDSKDHTSDSLSFHVVRAFSRVLTIQLSIGDYLQENLSQLGTHFLQGANGGQDFLGKGNQQTAKQTQEALAALAGIVALDTHTDLYHTPAKDDDTHGLDSGENEVGQIIHDGQRISSSCIGPGGQQTGSHHQTGPHSHEPMGFMTVVLRIVVGKFFQGVPPFQ